MRRILTPILTLHEIDALPRFSTALEDTRRRVPDDLREAIPDFVPGAFEQPFYGWEPLICFARLWWWN